MAGLLESVARLLFSSSEGRKPSRTTVRKTTGKKTAHTTTSSNTSVATEQGLVVEEDNEFESAEIVAGVKAIDRTVRRERTQKEVGREDYLLNQIDEFREKAQQLQSLLLSKESKVMELQSIVDEREGKARELETILNERQRKADGISEEVSKKIDALIEKVTSKMDEIGTTIEKDLEDGQQLSKQQMSELQDTLDTVTTALETLKGELSEKVHSENVKCYRNVADLFKSMEDKLDKVNEVEKKVLSVKKCTIAIIVLTVINMLGLAAFAFFELGAFRLFMTMGQ